MTLTYIFHSGSVLETGRSILIFDFWMDPVDIMESVLQSMSMYSPATSTKTTLQEKSLSGRSRSQISHTFVPMIASIP